MTKHDEIVLKASVPQEWADQFEDLAKQTGRESDELIREALAQYIGIDEKASTVTFALQQFENELTSLKEKVTELESYKKQVPTLLERLKLVEQMVAKVQAEVFPSNTFSPAKSLPLETSDFDDDDFDDEPDEILTDFLPR